MFSCITMNPVIITLSIIALICVVGGLVYIASLIQRLGSSERPELQSFTLLQNQIAQLQKDLGDRMGETHQAVRQSFASSNNIIRDVTEKLIRVEETTKSVLNVTVQLEKLQDILKNPKQRGVLGEYYLETILQNTLPPNSFKRQYAFRDGEIVDAVVFVKEKIIPIDSKFSLENYNRFAQEQQPVERERLEKLFLNDLKQRIQETAKYIRPEEGTMDFAFMFIPHEAIYYDLLVNKIGALGTEGENLIQRAAGKYRVIIVSPTSFLAYLQTVLQGLHALQIEEQAREIRDRVTDLNRHMAAYENYFRSLGKNLGTTVNQYNLSAKEFMKIDKDVMRITGSSLPLEEAPLIEKPSLLEEA